MRRHNLKTWPMYFEAVVDGSKTFEIRRNDRDYRPGDLLRLQEYDPDAARYTGREVTFGVGFVAAGALVGLTLGEHVVMSLVEPSIACTGLTARWCPVCGDCICERPANGLGGDLADPRCPLHSPDSDHATGVTETKAGGQR